MTADYKKANSNFRFVSALGLASFGLTLSVTVLTTYLPSRLVGHTNPLVIGLVVGFEGIFGLFMPLIMGVLSDRSATVMERLRVMGPAAAVCASALLLIGLIHNIWITGVLVGLFYVGYFSFLAPYWALYTDLIDKSYSGRARSAEAVWRVVGTIFALISGGFLIAIWGPLPFLLGSIMIVVVTSQLYALIGRQATIQLVPHKASFKESVHNLKAEFKENHELRALMFANACWNATLRSIQGFTILFFTQGLGRSESFVSGVIFPIAGIGIFLMAPFAGKLADRVGPVPLLATTALIFGVGTALPGFAHNPWMVLGAPVVAAAATAVMTLPEAMLIRVVRDNHHGAAAGLFGLSRGFGSLIGPLTCGAAIMLTADNIFESTQGYAAYWIVAGTFSILSLPAIFRMDHNRRIAKAAEKTAAEAVIAG